MCFLLVKIFSVAMCILLVKKLESMLFCKNLGKYCGAKRYSRHRGFNIAGSSAPAVPTPLDETALASVKFRVRASRPSRESDGVRVC